MVTTTNGISPAAWINRVVSDALTNSAPDPDAWCRSVACAMTAHGLTRAAVAAVDSDSSASSSGTSLDSEDPESAPLRAHVCADPVAAQDNVLFASAEYGSELVSGEVRVIFSGEVGLLRSHVPLLASLLAEVYRHRVAEPEARRAAILARLRPSQRPIVPLLTTGMSQRDISRVLGKSPHTVHDHTKMIYRTLDVHSRVELASKWHGFPIEQPSEA